MKFTISNVMCVFVLLITWSLEACQKCLDKGTIEMREECKVCRGSGKVFPPSEECNTCNGTGKLLNANGHIYEGHQGTRFCKRCRGTGTIQPNKINCGACAGQAVFIKRISCPSCGGKSGADTASQPQSSGTPSQAESTVPNVRVAICNLCGPDGKVKKTIVCEQCKSGYCHKKETDNGKDVFKCRKCGKVCADRYTPCACEKPDCTACAGQHKRVESKTCELCGGDGTITPMERANATAK